MNDSCRRQLENYKTALNHIARSFYDTYNIINAQDQSQAQLLRSVKRITEELGVPLDLSFKHEEEVRNKRMSVKNMANTVSPVTAFVCFIMLLITKWCLAHCADNIIRCFRYAETTSWRAAQRASEQALAGPPA